MSKTIRITLVTLLLILLVPIYTSDARINENRNEYNFQISCSDYNDNNYGNPSSLIRYAKVFEDIEFPSWSIYSEPVLISSPSGSWDDYGIYGPSVLYTGTKYHMWYSGMNENTRKYQIGYATSNNGRSWDKHPENPVLTVGEPGSWDDRWVASPTVLYNGSTWEMWYTGSSNEPPVLYYIGYASSEDGINWNKYFGNPVLNPGLSPAWDSNGVYGAYVMFENGIYHMWYSGSRIYQEIGYAESTDGIHWMKYPNPVIPAYGGGEYCWPHLISSPTVIHFDEYLMWAGSSQLCKADTGDYGIVHSFSSDKVTWSTPGFVFGPQSYRPSEPSVIYRYDGLLKQMWFVTGGEIYFAEDNQLLYEYLPLSMR